MLLVDSREELRDKPGCKSIIVCIAQYGLTKYDTQTYSLYPKNSNLKTKTHGKAREFVDQPLQIFSSLFANRQNHMFIF